MLYPGDNYGFSAPVMSRSKALCEGNGYSITEHRNAAAGHHRSTLRVALSTPTDCVTFLAKGIAIGGETRLAVDVDKLTEPAIITWIEH